MTTRVLILGSTGSIGVQALEVIAEHPERFQVVGLGAGGANLDLLRAQAQAFRIPAGALAVADPVAA
ncbi:1-deoxy-D-xylulose-5-phosphate reductoisomerase, partial [Streptomyces sp. SID10244]|nr:1-deoxy-D-xylulose-5-phosphate reductoisomerase [Streptomyces sp. SID10244]